MVTPFGAFGLLLAVDMNEVVDRELEHVGQGLVMVVVTLSGLAEDTLEVVDREVEQVGHGLVTVLVTLPGLTVDKIEAVDTSLELGVVVTKVDVALVVVTEVQETHTFVTVVMTAAAGELPLAAGENELVLLESFDISAGAARAKVAESRKKNWVDFMVLDANTNCERVR